MRIARRALIAIVALSMIANFGAGADTNQLAASILVHSGSLSGIPPQLTLARVHH